ncbi:hypothetical protein [Maritimibacter fusiformis]|uniref:Uncharacterized protein n=1 Tax=Maritimibacter fusiformis TaxID=2603819 RepID=A0A5D0RQ55_9RHOB|nr:hypothetical protein [Maritimibacter fusiformis]TYB83025.1 hypothetical protein FVF75_02245 [Maritimibacter fusiformis]
MKLFKRSSSFLDIWMTVFVISAAFFAISFFTVARYERENSQEIISPKLILSLKAGHAETCQIAIRNQIQSQGLKLSEDEIERQCQCVGDAYFNSLSQKEYDEMMKTANLPQRVLTRREDIQLECFVRSLTE